MRLWGRFAVVALALSACDDLPSIGGGKTARNEITVTADKVTLRGPSGFCVDPVSSQTSATQAFVVFGNCAAIAGNEALPQPFVTAVAIITVLPSGKEVPAIATSGKALGQYFNSAAGRATLSGAGDPSTVSVLDSFARNGAFFVHARDTSGPVLPGADPTFWRGYFDVKNSLVAVSVIGLTASPLSSDDGLRTLYAFANAILQRQTAAEQRADLQEIGGAPQRLFS